MLHRRLIIALAVAASCALSGAAGAEDVIPVK